MLKSKIIGLLLSFYVTIAYAQGEYNNWHFGWNRTLNFDSGIVTPGSNSAIGSGENCASISDSSGNLLFYTNGFFVWDKNNNIMVSGSGLMGNSDVQQGVLIVPWPNSTGLYYLFHIGDGPGTGGYPKALRYSIIDMALNSSLGEVTAKNVLLDADVSEKLYASLHGNGNDIWVVERNYGANTFKSYLINSNGLDTIPIISNVGISSFDFTGAIKISNDGCWLISTTRGAWGSPAVLELFHFDNLTGLISIGANTIIASPYGLEFSSDNTKFYIGHNDNLPIHQFNLAAGSDSLILASKPPVSDSMFLLSMQVAPDDKIYFATSDFTLGAIEFPNILGTGCTVSDSIVYFGDTLSSFYQSLPNNFNLTYTGALNCTPLAISEPYRDNASIFPNPNTGIFKLRFNSDLISRSIIEIHNVAGDIVHSVGIDETDLTHTTLVDIHDLSEGVYFYRLYQDGLVSSSGKFVICR